MDTFVCFGLVVLAIALGVFYGGAMLFTGRKQLDYFSDPWGLKRRKKRKDR